MLERGSFEETHFQGFARNTGKTGKAANGMISDVNFCKDHRDEKEVPNPFNVEDLISYKLNNRQKLARLITHYKNLLFKFHKLHEFRFSDWLICVT